MNKRAFRRLSLLTVLAMVFTQLSLAAYACSGLAFDDRPPAATVIAVDADCHGGAAVESGDVQCGFHCQDSPTVPASALPDLSPDQSALPLNVELRAAASPAALARQRDAALAVAAAPPAPLRYCRFLI